MSDPWYPPPDAYYVPNDEAVEYPLRQGDLVGPLVLEGVHVPLAQVVHPTCELGKRGVDRIQVCVVDPLSGLADDFQRACVVAGMREKDGRFLIAFAHTFYLPAIRPDEDGMFVDFRRLHLADRQEATLANRQAALTHDGRVYFIRRWLYFRFRILLAVDQVRGLEAERIRFDRAFEGPRPSWTS